MRLLAWILLLVAIVNPYTQSWIASHYVVADPLEPADAVIPLRGSAEEQQLRLDEAAKLVDEGHAPLLLVSTYSRPYYGHPASKLIEEYLREKDFPLEKVRFCENNADYTAEEAVALRSCLQQLEAKKAIVVTSDYHTRRSRFLFRRILSPSGIVVRIHPLYNSEYWDSHWWRRRRWTKTFVVETISLAWNALEQWLFFRPRTDFRPPPREATRGSFAVARPV